MKPFSIAKNILNNVLDLRLILTSQCTQILEQRHLHLEMQFQ